MQITALEQLKEEMQEELFQQSVDATKLHTLNHHLTAQLAKADDRNTTLQASITALTDDKLKVTSHWVVTTFPDDFWSSSLATCGCESSIGALCALMKAC